MYIDTIILFTVSLFFITASVIVFYLIFKHTTLNKTRKILITLNSIFLILNVIVLFIFIILCIISYYFIG